MGCKVCRQCARALNSLLLGPREAGDSNLGSGVTLLEEMHEKIKAEIEEAIKFAEEAPVPSLDALYQDVTVAPYIPQE